MFYNVIYNYRIFNALILLGFVDNGILYLFAVVSMELGDSRNQRSVI